MPGTMFSPHPAGIGHSQPRHEALWRDPDVTDQLAVLSYLRPYPAEAMDGYTVSPLVSSVRNDGPELVRPLTSA